MTKSSMSDAVILIGADKVLHARFRNVAARRAVRMLLTKSSMSDAIGPGADWCVTPHIYESQMVFTGDNYAISQIRVDDIEEMLLVPIDRVDRTQPFKLTIYFKTEGTPSASLDYITHTLNKFCHLDIHVGLFYHEMKDAATCVHCPLSSARMTVPGRGEACETAICTRSFGAKTQCAEKACVEIHKMFYD